MRKITFIATAAFFMASTMFAQTYSSGSMSLALDYSATIEVSPTTVTITFVAPDDRWFGLGFDATSMTAGQDVVIYDGITLTDREFIGVGSTPPEDAAPNDWTVTSDTASGGVRTVVATRALTTAGDYDFSAIGDGTMINLVYAKTTSPTFTLGYHGASDGAGNPLARDTVIATFATLSTPNFNADLNFSIAPNPAKEKFVVTLPTNIDNAQLDVYNVLGKRVLSQDISDINSTVNVSNWNSGIYIVRVSNGEVSQTKRFVKQ